MDKATPTPVGKDIDFNIEVKPYVINITGDQNELTIMVRKEGLLPRRRFEAVLKLEDLVKKSKWFKMFDTTIELGAELSALFTNRKFIIKEETNYIALMLKIELSSQNEVEIILSEVNVKNEDILLDICQTVNEMKQSLKTLTEKFSYAESTAEYQKILDKGRAVVQNNAILQQDHKDMISNWLTNNEKGNVTYRLLYKATIDGDEGNIFHQFCDFKGPTLTIVKTTKNYIFGGYTSLNWDKSGFRKDPKAFLFSVNLRKIYPIKNLDYSVDGKDNSGPIFGGGSFHDLCILTKCLSTNQNYCHLQAYGEGSFYEFNGNEQYFGVQDLEVYQVIIN